MYNSSGHIERHHRTSMNGTLYVRALKNKAKYSDISSAQQSYKVASQFQGEKILPNSLLALNRLLHVTNSKCF